MLKFTINDAEYTLKQSLNDITVGEYFQIMSIQSERCQKPLTEKDKFVDGTYNITYFNHGEEPIDFVWKRNNKIAAILTDVPLELLEQSPELSEMLLGMIDSLEDKGSLWSNKAVLNKVTKKVKIEKDGKTKSVNVEEEVETDYEWTYDKTEHWCFQQWVDSENASREALYNPFLIAIYKRKKGSKAKRTYDRSHPDFDDKKEYWLNQPAADNINVIMKVLNDMASVREMFYWIYEAETAFPQALGKTEKIYSTFAGWNDVVVSLSETTAFNSVKGTLHAVRNANCIEVLEFLNWKRGKSFAEYEDYKLEEQSSKFKNGGVIG